MINTKKVEIAKSFVGLHDDSDLDNWQPFVVNEVEKYLAIYEKLVAGDYGDISKDDYGTLEVEIEGYEHKSGNAFIFGFENLTQVMEKTV